MNRCCWRYRRFLLSVLFGASLPTVLLAFSGIGIRGITRRSTTASMTRWDRNGISNPYHRPRQVPTTILYNNRPRGSSPEERNGKSSTNRPSPYPSRGKSTPSSSSSSQLPPSGQSQSAQVDRTLFQQQQSSNSNPDPFRADFRDSSEPQLLMTTFGGGTALMFEMIAKKMLDWGNEAKPYYYGADYDTVYNNNENPNNRRPTKNSSSNNIRGSTTTTSPRKNPRSERTTINRSTSSTGPSAPWEEMVETSTSSSSSSSFPISSGADMLPRWHPHSGIAQINQNFRNEAPVMNNQGFAQSIWRNVRKRNKPSLWRQALRTYDRMSRLEEEQEQFERQQGTTTTTTTNVLLHRSNTHHEGAMVACSKLGMWQRALEIYHYVAQIEEENRAEMNSIVGQKRVSSSSMKSKSRRSSVQPVSPASSSSSSNNNINKRTSQSVVAQRRSRLRRTVQVTETMISALVHACVVASRERQRNHGTAPSTTTSSSSSSSSSPSSPLLLTPAQAEQQEAALRRIPLDSALEILMSIQDTHGIRLVARDVNPLAAAYQSLGYVPLATEMLQTMLSNRTAGEEPEDGSSDRLNVFDLCAKDKGSYSLLVQGGVVTGDWGLAVDALREMTEAGLYPKARHCNLWSEISERRTRPRAVGSRKKKRDDLWAESVP